MLKLKLKHMELVKNGKYQVAKLILRFMVKGSVLLGLDNNDWEASMILDKLGFRYSLSRSGWATYYLNNGGRK